MASETLEVIQHELESVDLNQDPNKKARLLNQPAALMAEEPAGLMRAIAYSETALELASHPAPTDLNCLADCLENLGDLYLQTTSSDLVMAYILKIRSFLDVLACSTSFTSRSAAEAGRFNLAATIPSTA